MAGSRLRRCAGATRSAATTVLVLALAATAGGGGVSPAIPAREAAEVVKAATPAPDAAIPTRHATTAAPETADGAARAPEGSTEPAPAPAPFFLPSGFTEDDDGRATFRSPRLRMRVEGASATVLLPDGRPARRGTASVAALRISVEGASASTSPARGRDPLPLRETTFLRDGTPRPVRRHRSLAPAAAGDGVAISWTTTAGGAPRFDLRFDAGADEGATVLRADAPGGGFATLEPGADGSLVARAGGGALRLSAPVAWEETPDGPRPVAAAFEPLGDGRFRFRVPVRDRRLPLVIDPVLEPALLMGGSGLDYAWATAAGGDGDVVLAGATASVDFPVVDPFQGTKPGGVLQADGFVARFDGRTGELRAASYLGGTDPDFAVAAAVHGDGSVFVLGATDSRDFPLANPFQEAFAGGDSDLIVARVSADGTMLLSSSYLGGSGLEEGWGAAPDGDGGAWIAGLTDSADFPVASPLQDGPGGGQDAFLCRLPADGGAPVFSTLLGGTGDDQGRALAVAADGSVRLAGWTASDDFPLVDPFQSERAGGSDGFVMALSADGSAVLWASLLGGSGPDQARAVTVDVPGRTWVAGWSSGGGPSPVDAFQPSPAGGTDGWIARLGDDGGAPVLLTFLGGSATDEIRSMAADGTGGVVVCGATLSSDFPLRHAGPAGPRGSLDGFVARVDGVDGSLAFAAVTGGSGPDEFQSVAALGKARFAVAGHAQHLASAAPDVPRTLRIVPAAGGGPRDLLAVVVDGKEAGLRRPRGRWRTGGRVARISAVATGEGAAALDAFRPGEDRFSLRLGPRVLVDIAPAGGGWTTGRRRLRWRGSTGEDGTRITVTLSLRSGRLRCVLRGDGAGPDLPPAEAELVLRAGTDRMGATGAIETHGRTNRLR